MENDQSYELSFEQLRQMEDAQQPPSQQEPAESVITEQWMKELIYERVKWKGKINGSAFAAHDIFEVVEPLQRELKEEKEQHQVSMDAMTNAVDTNEELTETISKLEAEIAELKKTEPSVSKEWEE